MDKNRIKLFAAGIGALLSVQAVAADEVTLRVQYEYDDMGRLVAERGNQGQSTEYTYDADGRVKSSKDAAGRRTEVDYNVLGQRTHVTDAAGVTSVYAYDAAGRIRSVTDPKGNATTYNVDGFGQIWTQTSPDTGTTTVEYGPGGLATRMTRNDGSTLTYGYDAQGRLTHVVGGTSERTFTYDACANGYGRLCQAVLRENGVVRSQVSRLYSPHGWLTQQRSSGIDEASQSYDDALAYAYDNLGRVTGVSYPSGVSVGYGYNDGQLTTMTATVDGANVSVASNITYQPYGSTSGWTYGNGLERLISRDVDGRVFAISAGTSTSLVQSLTYGFNVANEITAITHGLDATQSRNYKYDVLGRLYQETTKGSQWDYDANGTRSAWTDAGVATSYSLDATHNRILGHNGPTGLRSYGYDPLGNRISEVASADSRIYTYDPFNRMRTATVNGSASTYTTNALDQRAGKATPAGRTRFLYADQNQLVAEHGPTGWTTYLWLQGELVGVVKPDRQVRYVHTDHLGRPEAVTNSAKGVVWRARNEAWTRAVLQDSIGGLNVGLPGQYYDTETSLWYNGFRYYDSTTGYTQPDPIGLGGGLNPYRYAGANPISYIDPLGLQEMPEDHLHAWRPPIYNCAVYLDCEKAWDDAGNTKVCYKTGGKVLKGAQKYLGRFGCDLVKYQYCDSKAREVCAGRIYEPPMPRLIDYDDLYGTIRYVEPIKEEEVHYGDVGELEVIRDGGGREGNGPQRDPRREGSCAGSCGSGTGAGGNYDNLYGDVGPVTKAE